MPDGAAPAIGDGAVSAPGGVSGQTDRLGLRALLALADLELHLLTLFEGAVALHLDGRPVDEDVGATTVDGDEAVPLLSVEPIDGSVSLSLLLYLR
jgi:hypothetical protein